MMNAPNRSTIAVLAVLGGAILLLYFPVLAKLGQDWWTDENYSHGLLVPVIIAFIVWREWGRLTSLPNERRPIAGAGMILIALALLAAGMLGAELFIARVSFLFMIAGVLIYSFGRHFLNFFAVPIVLLALSIPIPQIIFNKIAFPLQILASRIAVWGIRIFDVPTLRKGNVIEILPFGSTQTIALEVVEACSGIRSLMTLVTLALILAYFTRTSEGRGVGGFIGNDLVRAALLMLLAVPIAVVTNAARVSGTGIIAYKYGKVAVDGPWHDISGWLVFVVAIGALIAANQLLKRWLTPFVPRGEEVGKLRRPLSDGQARHLWPLIVLLLVSGVALHWLGLRPEVQVARAPLAHVYADLGEWRQRGNEIKFDPQIESVLRTSDYTMREYVAPSGRVANIYIGYYASQKSGATYHSPLNCLPGAGWVMEDPQVVDISLPDGRSFKANRYLIRNGIYNEVMIYWYQGRGRTESSEYRDKLNTIWDSITRGRTDGALIRVMTSVGNDEAAGVEAASQLAARVAESLPRFVPE